MKYFRALLAFPMDIWAMIVNYLPGAIGYVLRYRFWKARLRQLGDRVTIEPGVYFQRPEFIEIGDNCWIDRGVMILAGPDNSNREKILRENPLFPGQPGVVHIGKNVHIGPNSIISGIAAGVHISDDCGLSAGARVYAFSHHYRSRQDPSKKVHFGPRKAAETQCLVEGSIFLGENTGVALNAVILPGTALLPDSFVSVNSVVIGGVFPENSILAGNPARVTSHRFKKG